jgi:replicative DNA helicase
MGLHIVDKGGLSMPQLNALARSLTQRHGIKLIVVDYLGLLRSGKNTVQNTRKPRLSATD